MKGLKLKISAAAVAVNALMAMTLVGAAPAKAQSCTPRTGCVAIQICSNQQWLNAFCQNQAPAGCTLASAQCSEPICPPYPLPGGIVLVSYQCNYQ